MNSMNDYDIDNIDVVEEIEEKIDIEDSAEFEEELIEEEINEFENKFKKERAVLNIKNLSKDLTIKVENDRTKYIFEKNGVTYYGYVVYKMDKNNFVFNVTENIEANGPYKLKKFNITEIK